MTIAHIRFVDMELLRLRPDQVHLPDGCMVCARPAGQRRMSIGAGLQAQLCDRCFHERYSMQTLAAMSGTCLALLLPCLFCVALGDALTILAPFVLASAGAARWFVHTLRWRRRLRVRVAPGQLQLTIGDPSITQHLQQAALDDYRGSRPVERSMVRPARGSCRR
jgi:hypothetical protein